MNSQNRKTIFEGSRPGVGGNRIFDSEFDDIVLPDDFTATLKLNYLNSLKLK